MDGIWRRSTSRFIDKLFFSINYLKKMSKIFFFICLICLLGGCKQEKNISYSPYKALRCESNNKKLLNTYIFNKNNGYLYFYEPKSKEFIPLNLRFEAGFFSEDITEFSSTLKKNKLIITAIDYGNNPSKEYKIIKHIIDLKKLVKTTIYTKEKKDFVSSKGKCNWIDPKLGIK